MKKRIPCVAIGALIALSASIALISCGEEKNKKTTEDVVTITKGSPVSFIAGTYTDESITSSSFTVEYNSKYTLTAQLKDSSLATLTEKNKTTTDSVTSVTYTLSSNGVVGETEIEFLNGAKVVDSVRAAVKAPYPSGDFGTLTWSAQKDGISYSHDPVVLEVPEGYTVNGETFYYFSYATDNEGGYGVPVKASKDLVNWVKIGSAIPEHGTDESEVYANVHAGESEIQKVYDLLSADSAFSCYTLWAPDVVRAPDGGYYLYSSWTTTFGSRRSAIFMCYSESPVGPFSFKDIIVYSPSANNDDKQSNAIDPSVFYDTDGNMYLSYGSFSDFRVIELNPDTGLRKDGASYTVEQMSGNDTFYATDMTSDQYFGTRILKNTNIEGSVVQYFADVPVYSGDVSSYADDKLTYQSNYYLMGSAGSLSADYNMRVYKSATPTGTYSSGVKISGNFSWGKNKAAADSFAQLNHYVPGHNDILITSQNEKIIAYHNKVGGVEGSLGTQFLYTGLLAFNSNGDLVMSPNRYAGESLRKVTADEITKLSSGNYFGVTTSSNASKKINYAQDYTLNADGTISGAADGTWTLYGDNYMYIVLDGFEYYGVVMPALCVQKNNNGSDYNGGLVISAIGSSGKEQRTLFMEMAF